MSTPIPFRSATQLAEDIQSGTITPVEVVDALLDRIDSRDDAVNAFITVTGESARSVAEDRTAALAAGDSLGPLHGVPVAIKDLTAVADVPQTFGAAPLADFVPDESATVVDRLRAAGAIVIGKTNTPEFGLKVKTDNLLVGPTSTPFDLDRNAGGSSGGSAAAVAAGMAPIAEGSDAGGSVRIPSAFCGVVGVKPSFGRIPLSSRPNAFAAHTPFIHEGIHARTVADAALALDVLAGPDDRDPFSIPGPQVSYREALDRSVADLRVAFSPDLGIFPIDDRVADVVAAAVDDLGTVVETVDSVSVEFGHELDELVQDTSMVQWEVETAAMAATLEETMGLDVTGADRDDLPSEMVEMVEAGRTADPVAYRQADLARTDVYDGIQDILDDYDLLASPVTTVPPFSNDVLGPTEVDGVEVDPLSGWFLTFPYNMSGHPAVSVPAGLTDEGLPVGIQLAGRRFQDETLLAAAAALEDVRPWQDDYPWA
ncbi:MAG: amidase [Halobacteriaceae archaeon]